MNSEKKKCFSKLRKDLLEASKPENYFKLNYSMLYWTDLGNLWNCKDFSKDNLAGPGYTTLDSTYI